MNEQIINEIALKLNKTTTQVSIVLKMLEEKATVAFIARYRKEMTGALDEEEIRLISKEYDYFVSLLKRKEDVIRLIDEKGMLNPGLKNSIMNATKLVEVDDLYRPYKEKKKTKASEAIAKGLEPLAKIIMSYEGNSDKDQLLDRFITSDVLTKEDALSGALNIIAEWISDNASYRHALRNNLNRYGVLTTKLKKPELDETKLYDKYYEYSESIKTIKPHRILAINRAESTKVIGVNIVSNYDIDIAYLNSKVIKKQLLFDADIKKAIVDSYKRLISPSIEREVRSELTSNAEENAIGIFSMNLKKLLLQSPMKGQTVLGVDPAFRTGCKLAVVDELSKLLEIDVIYPNELQKGKSVKQTDIDKSKNTILNLIKKYNVSIIAIGNGTASRETESFIANIIKENKLDVKYVIVSEAGASVYSASDLAIKEFPNLEVQERSAISIARRLQDPLSELVKIEPKAIGVGQYQHDVAQNKLTSSLDDVVSEAVNKVGVNVNTASVSLLTYVSGLNKTTASNIIKYREEFGKINNRNDLKKVSKLGSKTYEQAVGFLRILDGSNQLDKTSIHPESYKVAMKLMQNLKIEILGSSEAKEILSNIDKEKLKKELDIDIYTLNDIIDAFIAPTRDIRDEYSAPKLRSDITHLEDLKVGDELEGTVRNVVDFGAFIDCGLKNDGLVHLSKMSKTFIKHPSELLGVGDLVKVYVIGVDLVKSKLSLSMIKE